MSKEKGKTQNKKRKLTRQEKKQIDALIRQSKGDGKPHTAQDSIPFERMYKDGICRLANGRYSKCIEFEDINYQLAQPDDKTAIFEALCDMYNSFDASISVQLSLISRHANKEDFKSSITIAPQNDDFDSIRAEYTEMLQTQLERGNNGLIKTKFLTFTIEAKDIKSARARLARIETDTLNHFKVIRRFGEDGPDEALPSAPNTETTAAIENVQQGKNLSPTFGSVAELMEDLKR